MSASVPEGADNFFSSSWKVDISGDCILQRYEFIRRPLVIEVNIEIEEQGEKRRERLVILGLHLKSKHIRGAEKRWRTSDIDQKILFIKESVINRRRIAAEVSRCRKFVDICLDADPDM